MKYKVTVYTEIEIEATNKAMAEYKAFKSIIAYGDEHQAPYPFKTTVEIISKSIKRRLKTQED